MENFDIEARYIELGSAYGAWPVCTDAVSGPLTVYGVGVGTDISWDLAVLERFDAKVHAFDPTPVSKNWISRQENLPAEFCFHPVGLAAETGVIQLSSPETEGFASFHINSKGTSSNTQKIDVPVASLGELMEENGHDHIDILKIDIEGSEYPVIEALTKTKIRPTQILIEFHHDMYGFTWRDTNTAHRQLQEMGYRRYYRSARGGREQGFVLERALQHSKEKVAAQLSRAPEETPERGVVYFAFGVSALREANLSTRSLRISNPSVPSAIFTDLPEQAEQDIVYQFSSQELRDIEYHFKETGRMASLKVRFLMNSPFEKTVVLDADTYVKGDISEMFDALDEHDIALTNMPEIEQGIVEGYDRPVHKSLKSLTRKGAFSCAVFAFRKSSAMQALAFEWWSQFVEKTSGDMRLKGNWGAVGGGINEQSILHHMMADGTFSRCDVKRTLLPNTKFNAGMSMWPRLRKEGLWEDCSILHSHLIAQKLNDVGIEGLPDLPNLQKFA